MRTAAAAGHPTRHGFRAFWRARSSGPQRAALLLFLLAGWLSAPAFGQTAPGTVIPNQATLSYIDPSGSPATVLSNQSDITTVVIRTDATLELLRVVSGAGSPVPVGPTACFSGGPVPVPLPDPVLIGGTVIDPNTPQELADTDVFHTGEPLFVRLEDGDQNLDSLARETVEVDLTSTPPGDTERIRMTETAADSGVFAGYIQTGSGAAAPGDCVLQVVADGTVGGRYQDPADATDPAADAGLVDPFGMVFDSGTGDPIDGARVQLVVVATGLPATVFGDDGVSSFPAEVTSGGSATDSGGTVYTFPPGGFRFPLVAPGDYRFVVVPPPGYLDTSAVSIPVLQTLPGAPFALGPGSFGNPFAVDAGPAVDLDLPLDPVTGALYLQMSTTSNVAGAGDFIQFSLTVANTSRVVTIPGVEINDVLPFGFRYIEGSARMGGLPAVDPTVSPDGRTLNFAVGDLAPDTSADIRYVVEVTVGAQGESATNRAIAVGSSGEESNEATATVQLSEDLFRSKSTLVGRVIQNGCDDDVANDLEGMAGIRVFMEDGRYALTDEGGRFHFTGLNPGTHVVQMDLDTLPDYLEPLACEHNTRFAGSTFSRFVDLKAGSLWRADFHLRERPGPSGTVSLRLTSNVDDNGTEVDYAVTLAGTAVPIEDLRVTVILPDGLSYEPGTARVDGIPAVEDSQRDDRPRLSVGNQTLTWRLGGRQGAWTSRIDFGAMLQTYAEGDLTTRAVALFDTPGTEDRRTGVAENLFRRRPQRNQNMRYIVATNFDTSEAVLNPADKAALNAVIADWADATDVRLVAIGHTDTIHIQPRNTPVYADNYDLSLARAQAVADYVGGALGLAAERIEVVGRGPDQPVATNWTVEGRAQNRRVRLLLMGDDPLHHTSLDIVRDDSGVLTVEVNGVFARSADPEPLVAEEPKFHPVFTESGFIERLAPGTGWVAPVAGFSPLIPSLKVAIKHAPKEVVELFLNSRPVSPLNFDSTEFSADESLAVSRWRGIDLEDGNNDLLALIRDQETGEFKQLQRAIQYSGGPVRGQLDPEQSRLVADGKTRPVIALRMFDRWGARARAATIGTFRVDPPYRSWWEVESLRENQLVAVGQREPTYKVASDGLAYIELEPTTQTGEAVLHLVFPDNREQDVRIWLEPEPRDWILVGFAEGTLGYNTLSDNALKAQDAGFEEDLYEDGRLVFFGKGQIKGEFLLTLAYDSDLDEEEAKRRLHGTIAPDRFYTLYGDGTEQRFEAASQEKLYVKIERKAFFALFGDYDTGLTVTELSRYSRSLSGLQSEYRGERFSYSAFASNTDTSFVKDEILGDGTSGLYHLSRSPIIINSDKVRIEVRDRFRSELVLETRELSRYLDYDIDYLNGTLFMKHPVESRDANFNPTYIVIDYESQDSTDEEITAGGRAALKVAGQRLEIGATAVHEGTVGAEGDLLGTDLSYRISDNAEFKAEIAYTDTATGGTGLAYLAAFDHQGERSQARAYVIEQEPEFGLGQRMSTEAGMRKFGADARTQLTSTLSLVGSTFRQENLTDDAQRDVLEAEIRYQVEGRTATLGLLSARDDFASGPSLASNQASATGSMDLFDSTMTLRGAVETAFGGNDENMDYPDRGLLGMDYHLTDSSTLFAEVESAAGASFESLMTRAGVKTRPWNNTQLNSTVSHETTEYGPRTFATLGLIQGWQMNEHWLFDFGLDQARTVGDPSPRVNEAVPPASGTNSSDFLASYAGALYRSEDWTFTSRLEYRRSDLEDRIGLFGGFYREQRDGHGFSANLQLFDSQSEGGFGNTTADLRLGWAWRPPDSEWIVFDRLDLIYEDRDDGSVDLRSSRIVNNLNANWMMDRRTQLAFQYGAKYVRTNIDAAAYTGYTDLFGAGFRRDLNERWDAGLHADVLHSWNSELMQFSWGVDLGITFAKNIWLSVGYNFAGFRDDDFSVGNYTAQGPFITIRMKADQETLKELATRWGRPKPDAVTAESGK